MSFFTAIENDQSSIFGNTVRYHWQSKSVKIGVKKSMGINNPPTKQWIAKKDTIDRKFVCCFFSTLFWLDKLGAILLCPSQGILTFATVHIPNWHLLSKCAPFIRWQGKRFYFSVSHSTVSKFTLNISMRDSIDQSCKI